MLRINLSTRPFYNERAVHFGLFVVALLVGLLTAYNAIRIMALSRHNTELSALINHDRAEAQRLTAEAQRVRAGIDQVRLKSLAEAAGAANVLIDQRTFSWTEFFNRIEATLPPDVMLTSVQPSFQGTVPVIQMAVLGRRTEDIGEFMEELEATGAFNDVLLVQEDRTDEGLFRGVVRSVYTGGEGVASGEEPPEAETGSPGPPARSATRPEAAAPEAPAAAAATEGVAP
jgi:Tfp pilus assembly protein PilN